MNCFDCNGKIDDTDNFCRHCGIDLKIEIVEYVESHELVLSQFARNIQAAYNRMKTEKTFG